MKGLFLGFFALFLLFFSCRKDEDLTTIAVDLQAPQELVVQELSGIVINVNEIGLGEALVEIIQNETILSSTKTDAQGAYQFNLDLQSNRQAQVRITKPGYVTSYTILNETNNTSNDLMETVLMQESSVRGNGRVPNLPDSLILLTGAIKDVNEMPAVRYVIMVENSAGEITYAYTARGGYFRIVALPDQVLQLSVQDPFCQTTLLESRIGPFAENQDLGMLTIPNSVNSNFLITGQLTNCDGQPLSRGIIQADFAGQIVLIGTDPAGSFAYELPTCLVEGVQQFTATAFDADYQNASATKTIELSQSQINVGEISVCTTGETNIQFIIEGDTLIDNNLHRFEKEESTGNVVISPLFTREGFNLSFQGQGIGSWEATKASFSQGYLTAISDPSLTGTELIVEITSQSEDQITGSFLGKMIRSNTRALVEVSGNFSISN